MKYLLLLLLLIPTASATWFYNSGVMDISMDISSSADIERDDDATLEYINVNLTFFPYSTPDQKIISLTTDPKAVISEDSMLFTFENPTTDKIEFSLNSNIQRVNSRTKVKTKIEFPLTGISDTGYIMPSETIDSDNPEIFELANELAAGETDLFGVTFNLAAWVKSNIRYSLSSLTADVSQKSSWVIKTRQGVCDEITNLFIALCRSLGIPAKFVSGVAYTNSPEFPESWGAHGWAEVYFPGYGWMPFDVTYGEYGFIDPTHVKLKESLDPNEPSTKYKWFGYNTDIKTSQLTINTELKRYSGSFPDEISIQAKPFVKEVAFGSYNIIEATVKNLNDYYVATDLRIIKPEEVTADESLPVMLRPGEEKIVFFVVQLTGRFDPDYIYFFPVKIVSSTNISASSEFNASSHGTYLTLEEVNAVVKQKTTETKEFRTSLVLVCTPEKKEFYQYEEAYANCNIRNNGNVLLKALKICLETDCRNIELGISETKQVRFALPKTKLGQQIASITAENQDISNAAYLEYSVLDEPDIEITDITYPGSVSYDDTYQISYTINKISSSIPEDVSVKLDYGFVKEWVISELNVNKKFDLTMSAEELSVGANRFFIIVSYEDKNGKAFQKQQEFEITLNKPTFTQRIRIFFNDIGKFIIGIFT